MSQYDYIQRHIHTHQDPFVQDLYRELDRRITILEEGNEDVFVKRMTLRDYVIPAIITIAITAMLIQSIASNM